MSVSVTKGDIGSRYGTLFVTYARGETDARIAEKDFINFWGEVEGLITFATVVGDSVTMPRIRARYIEKVEE